MKKKADVRKCQYSHCKHQDRQIVLATDDYVEENNRYYHADCKHELDTWKEIKDFWYRNIDDDVVFTQLTRIIDKLVYIEHYDCDYILWALKKKAKYLKHPPGLIYVVKDKELKKEYELIRKTKEFNEKKVDLSNSAADEPVFTYNERSGNKAFGDIFGGK